MYCIVTPKRDSSPIVTYPNLIPNLYAFLSCVGKKRDIMKSWFGLLDCFRF